MGKLATLLLAAALLLTAALLFACTQRIVVVRKSRIDQPATNNAPVQPGNHRAFQDCLDEGLMLLRQEKYEGARFLLRQATNLNPESWQAYYYRGLVSSRCDQYARAHDLLDSALIYAPRDNRTRGRIYLLLAQTCEQRGRLGQAQLNYITALNLCPDSSPAATALKRLRQLQQE